MKLFRHGSPGHENPGMLDAAGKRRDLSGKVADINADLLAHDFAAIRGLDASSLPLVANDARFGPPVAHVGKFICIGMNFAKHVREAGGEMPTEPVMFMKATSAVIGPDDDVIIPPGAEKVDWEVEVGVVIGREARYVSEADAASHIAGLCTINDISERAYQLERGGQWDKGKGCDTFGPIGPYLVSLDEIDDINNLNLWLDLNGTRMQDGSTSDHIFNIPYIVHYVSQFMSLQPGDIISTGTPSGVGLGLKPPTYLKEGDVMRLGVSGLGEQQQTVRRYGS